MSADGLSFPVRINKYLASRKHCTRRGADGLVADGKVRINGRVARVGELVHQGDEVEVRAQARAYRYYAYHKPRGVITHSPQGDETAIEDEIPIRGVFPIGRLDKDSYGLIILTDDGRITDALLNPAHTHEKEYQVSTRDMLPPGFKRGMERGVDIGGYKTKPCIVQVLGKRTFSIILTEGKKHQIRRMCGAFGMSAVELKRVRIMNVRLGALKAGELRPLKGAELSTFLDLLGIGR